MQKLMLPFVLLCACAAPIEALEDGEGAPYEELPSDVAAPANPAQAGVQAMNGDVDPDLEDTGAASAPRWAPAVLPIGRYAIVIEATESNVCGRMRNLGDAGYTEIVATGNMEAPTLWERGVIETDGEVLRIQESAAYHGFMGLRCAMVETVQAEGEQTAPGVLTLQVFHAIETEGEDCEILSKIPRCAEEFTLTLSYDPLLTNVTSP